MAFLLDDPAGDSSLIISDVAMRRGIITYVTFASDGKKLFRCEVAIAVELVGRYEPPRSGVMIDRSAGYI